MLELKKGDIKQIDNMEVFKVAERGTMTFTGKSCIIKDEKKAEVKVLLPEDSSNTYDVSKGYYCYPQQGELSLN